MIVLLTLTPGPVLRATRAHKYESHAVFCWLCVAHCLVVATVFTLNILTALQSGVLDALWIYE